MKVYTYKAMLAESGLPYLEQEKEFHVDGRYTYTHPDAIVDFLRNGIRLQNNADEYCYCLCFDSKMHLIGCFEVSHGTVNGSLISPREIYQKSLMMGAVRIVLSHNHPSGDPTPSGDDISATQKVIQAGKLLGVECVDHIIVSSDAYVSLKEYSYI